MLFNSIQFFVFFVIVYGLYLGLKHKWQNRMLLVASYLFYASWDWRFLSLIFISTVLDYFCGLKIHDAKSKKERKWFAFLSVFINLTILGIFKYFNFFVGNLQALLSVLGVTLEPRYYDIILPMGISFYTFQSMSYTLDIYRRELVPSRSLPDFALYVSFFPQLVAGPIERAKRLLPQILAPRTLTPEKIYEGSFLIFWGLFLKAYVADNLASVVDPFYSSQPPYNGARALIATYAFTLQIFCDFAGYSSVARGLGKLMGFDIMVNFNMPFFVTNIQDYWNRWHISLSSWLRDYVYVPMVGGMRRIRGNTRLYLALMISMVLIGLWHGAAWTYVIFGVYYGALLSVYLFIRLHGRRWIQPKSALGQGLWLTVRMVFMFHLIVIGMMIFRSQYPMQSIEILQGVLTSFQLSSEAGSALNAFLWYSWALIIVESVKFARNDGLYFYKAPFLVRTPFYLVCFYLFMMYGITDGKEFIYFQF